MIKKNIPHDLDSMLNLIFDYGIATLFYKDYLNRGLL
jgi:hypothetical protein